MGNPLFSLMPSTKARGVRQHAALVELIRQANQANISDATMWRIAFEMTPLIRERDNEDFGKILRGTGDSHRVCAW